MNKQVLPWMLVLVVTIESSTTALAYNEWYAGSHGGVAYSGNGYHPGYGYGGSGYGGYGYGGYGAQTPFSANATGMGNLVRSAGQYNQQTSEAEINYQKARSEYIDNQQKIHNDMLERKRESQAQDAKDLATAQEASKRGDEFLMAHRPAPLASSQLNSTTGGIQWPKLLKNAEFNDLRTSLDSSFETLAKSGADADLSTQIEMQINALKDLLRTQITNIPMPEYSESRKFLDRLAASAKS